MNRGGKPLSFALVGAGFWARYQIAAWREVPGIRLSAICDLDRVRAESLAAEFEIPRVYASASAMLEHESLDFLDIATGPESHLPLVTAAARRKIPVICQKPMALKYPDCEEMVRVCDEAGVSLSIHENFRWQTPMRRIREILRGGTIGPVFRAHLQFSHGDLAFFERQPYLYTQPHFAMFDMGPHLLDLARCFLGEPIRIQAREMSVDPHFTGADIVSIVMDFPHARCHCELSWRTSGCEVHLEGSTGAISWFADGRLTVESKAGAFTETLIPKHYSWADPKYGFAHPSIVDTNSHLAAALKGERSAESSGSDNLKTMRLLHLALISSQSGEMMLV